MSSLYAVLSVLAISLVSLVGVFTLSLKEQILRKYIFVFVSLAIGALLGDAFIHLIPEAFKEMNEPLIPSLLIIGGILLFFFLEKFLHWHHHEPDNEHKHTHHIGKMILISDGLHNIIDGIIIGISYLSSIELGIATTIAVILHEIPQEIGDFGVLIHAGYSKKRALFLNFLSALSALLGVGIALILGEFAATLSTWFLPIAAGGFIYIAMADLIPELQRSGKTSSIFSQIFAILIGVGAMIGLIFLEG